MPEIKLTTEELKAMLANEERQIESTPPASHARNRIDIAVAIFRELIERREYMSSLAKADDPELDATAHHLAYEYCVSAIDGCVEDVSDEACVAGWFELANTATNYDAEEHVAYLEARGLIERDPAHPTWIAIREESEATR